MANDEITKNLNLDDQLGIAMTMAIYEVSSLTRVMFGAYASGRVEDIRAYGHSGLGPAYPSWV
jgi:hypothetical protein